MDSAPPPAMALPFQGGLQLEIALEAFIAEATMWATSGDVSEAGALQKLEALADRFRVKEARDGALTHDDVLALCRSTYPEMAAAAGVDALHALHVRRMGWRAAYLACADLVDRPSTPADAHLLDIPKVVDTLAHMAGSCVALTRGASEDTDKTDKTNEGRRFIERDGARILKFSVPEPSALEITSLAVIKMVRADGYALARPSGLLVKQTKTSTGGPARAWQPVMVHDEAPLPGGKKLDAGRPLSVEELVQSYTPCDSNGDAGGLYSRKCSNYHSILSAITKEIECGNGIKTVCRARGVFSFDDGLYVAHHGDLADVLLPHDAPDIPARFVAAKYFPATVSEFVACADWRDISTPSFDRVMLHQAWPAEVRELFYALVGRMMYTVGACDAWQIFPYLLGTAGTGKSLVTDMIGKMYEKADVGVFSDGIEKTFGLSGLIGRFVVIGPEINKGNNFGQSELQSMVSGETMKVNTKCKTAYDTRWTAPVFLAGNELPDWNDKSGSMARRLVAFPFSVPVTAQDAAACPDLAWRIESEIPALIVKANRAYRARVASDGASKLRLPSLLARARDESLGNNSSLVRFLCSDRIERGEGFRMRLSELVVALVAYEREMNVSTRQRVSGNLMTSSVFGCSMLTSVGLRMDGREVVGCRLEQCAFGAVF